MCNKYIFIYYIANVLNLIMHPIIYGVLLITVRNVNAFEVEIEGSGEVCNVEGSTCPEDNCCRKEI